MSKAKPFKVHSQEEGRGRRYTKSFTTLAEAAEYIKDRWQGADYIDGVESFHTDYSTYECEGFTLKDIGKMGWEGMAEGFPYRTYEFNPLPATTGGAPNAT